MPLLIQFKLEIKSLPLRAEKAFTRLEQSLATTSLTRSSNTNIVEKFAGKLLFGTRLILSCSNCRRRCYNKFHGLSSFTIRELEQPEWVEFCEQLNRVSTPFRNLGIWAGLLQSPEYENEVMILFSHMLQHFNMRIIQFGVRFPDAIVERKIDGKWQKQYIEFELRSSGFQTHLPDCKKNEEYVIVCWEDNWVHPKKSRFEIIELKTELEKIL